MRRSLLLFGLLSGWLVCAHEAAAAPVNSFRIAGWSGGSYLKESSKRFDHCRASTANAGGTAIIYAVNHEYRWSLSFSHPTWNFSKGLWLNLTLDLGDRERMRGRAFAFDAQALEVLVDDNIALFARLRTGGHLAVTAGGLAFEFQLADSDEVLSALAQCVLRSTGLAQPARAKRAAAEKSIAFAALDAATREEARMLAGDIMGYARIADARMATPAEVPAELRAAAVWKTGLITSGVLILRPNEPIKLEEVPEKLIESEARTCAGGFFFMPELDAIDHAPVARAFISCKTPEVLTSTYHLAVPRPRGGAYLISTQSKSGGLAGVVARQTEEVDYKVRAVVMPALKRLEQELVKSRP